MNSRILKTFSQLLLLSVVLFAVGCKGNDVEPEIDCTGVTVSYATDIVPILTSTCNTTNCHTAGFSPGDFTSYAGLKAKVDNGSLRTRIANKTMPSGTTLTDDEIQKIVCWVDAGGLEN